MCDAVAGDDVTDMENTADDTRNMPEYLTVCAWRSIKEVSLLLGQLTSTAPVIDPSKVSDPDSKVTDPDMKAVDGSNCLTERNNGLLTVDLVSEH